MAVEGDEKRGEEFKLSFMWRLIDQLLGRETESEAVTLGEMGGGAQKTRLQGVCHTEEISWRNLPLWVWSRYGDH